MRSHLWPEKRVPGRVPTVRGSGAEPSTALMLDTSLCWRVADAVGMGLLGEDGDAASDAAGRCGLDTAAPSSGLRSGRQTGWLTHMLMD